jgi:hypothetical protein
MTVNMPTQHNVCIVIHRFDGRCAKSMQDLMIKIDKYDNYLVLNN